MCAILTQDWAADSVQIKSDQHHWEPGYSRGQKSPWEVGRQEEETYTMVPKNGEKKAWNGF